MYTFKSITEKKCRWINRLCDYILMGHFCGPWSLVGSPKRLECMLVWVVHEIWVPWKERKGYSMKLHILPEDDVFDFESWRVFWMNG